MFISIAIVYRDRDGQLGLLHEIQPVEGAHPDHGRLKFLAAKQRVVQLGYKFIEGSLKRYEE